MLNLYRCRTFVSCLLLTGFAASYSLPLVAQVRDHPDYLALEMEAEDFDPEAFDGDDLRWTLTDSGTPQTEQDPDGNHSDGAVGKQYLELLPDVRVVHGDAFGPPTALWGQPGTGPSLEYTIDFPESGRYYVHIRALSTGSEDNGIHVGLNDTWPKSGERWQSCAGGQGWQWSSRQRDSGGAGPCGADFTVWLDVEEAGINTVKFSAREDGYEFDRFVLIKDRSDNTRVCRGAGEDQINCVDGSIETVDDFVDAAVTLEVDRSAGVQQDLFEFTAVVSNEDNFDTANQVVLEADLELGDTWEFISSSYECVVSGTSLSCELGNMEPTAPDEDENVGIILRALAVGEHTISVGVSTDSVDEEATNDSDSVTVTVDTLIEYTTLASTTTSSSELPTVDERTTLTINLENTGEVAAENSVIRVDLPEALVLVDVPQGCVDREDLVCELGTLEASSSQAISIDVMSDSIGLYVIALTVASDNLLDGSIMSTFTHEVHSAVQIASSPDVDEQEKEGGVIVASSRSGGGSLYWPLASFMLLILLGRLCVVNKLSRPRFSLCRV